MRALALIVCALALPAAFAEDQRKFDMDVGGMHTDKLGKDQHMLDHNVAPPCFDRNRAFYRHLADLATNPPLTEGQTCVVKIEQELGYIREADFTECPAGATGPIGKILFERQPFPVSDDECFDEELELVFRGQARYPIEDAGRRNPPLDDDAYANPARPATH